MKKKPVKPIHYYDKCWKWDFYFILGTDQDSAIKWMKNKLKWDAEPLEQSLGVHSHVIGSRVSVIWVEKRNNYPTLAHECIHAAIRCLDENRITAILENEEALTMLVGCLMREALRLEHK